MGMVNKKAIAALGKDNEQMCVCRGHDGVASTAAASRVSPSAVPQMTLRGKKKPKHEPKARETFRNRWQSPKDEREMSPRTHNLHRQPYHCRFDRDFESTVTSIDDSPDAYEESLSLG